MMARDSRETGGRTWPKEDGHGMAPEPGVRVAYDALCMVKADFINRAMKVTLRSRPDAGAAVDALFESLCAALARGDRVVLRRFGVFHTRPRKTGKARNPRTGEPAGIPPGRVVRFRPAPRLRHSPGDG